MLKVAVVTDYFPTSTQPWNGHSAYQTLRLLAKMCDVHAFYPEATYPAFIDPRKTKLGIDRNWSPPDVPATYIPYPVLPVVSRPLNGFTSAWKLLPYVRAYRPDIILNYAVYPYGLAAVRIGQALGVPVVLTAIGSDLNRISDAICRELTRWTLRHAAFTTTVSHHLCATARTLGAPADRSRAILNGCDTAVFHPHDRQQCRKQVGIPADDKTILYVGRLDYRKGLLELIESVATLSKAQPAGRPRIHCYLVGDGPDRPLLVEAIAKHKAAHSITLVPPCKSDRIALWMGAADLVTLPSYNEGCPNVVIEAVSSGRPMVATNVGGIPELMDDACGRLVPVRDVPALTHALAEVLDTPWDAGQISRTHSRSWQSVADDLYAILQQVASR